VPALAKAAASDTERDARIAALDALGNIGDAAAVGALLGAAQSAKEQWEKTKACEDSLLAAKRLVEAGDKKTAATIYKTLWS
jgi:HEAT repeat protein